MTPPLEFVKIAADISEVAEQIYEIAKKPSTNENELKRVAESLEVIRDRVMAINVPLAAPSMNKTPIATSGNITPVQNADVPLT